MLITGNNKYYFSHAYDKVTIQNIALTQACFFTLLKNFSAIYENNQEKEFFEFSSIEIDNTAIMRHKQTVSSYHFDENTSARHLLEQLLFFSGDLNFYHFYKAVRIGRSEVLLNKNTATYEYEFEFGIISMHIQFENHVDKEKKVILEHPKSISFEAIPYSSGNNLMFNEPVGNRYYQELDSLHSSSLPLNVFGQPMVKI